MANTYAFKSVTSEDIGVSEVDILTPAASKNAIIMGCDIANTTGSAVAAEISITKSGGVKTLIGNDIDIPANSTLKIIDGQKHVLETGDKITVKSDTATSIDVVLSYLEETVA